MYKPAVLLIDTEKDNKKRECTIHHLTTYFRVVQADSRRDALEKLAAHPIQLIMIYHHGYSSVRLCQSMKHNSRYAQLPIVLLKDETDGATPLLDSSVDVYLNTKHLDTLPLRLISLLPSLAEIRDYFQSLLPQVNNIETTDVEEQLFLNRVFVTIYFNLNNPHFNARYLTKLMAMSRSAFYRKLKNLIGLSPKLLIDAARLQKAKNLLQQGHFRIQEIADLVGYSHPNRLGYHFQRAEGQCPRAYKHHALHYPT